ncbi:MAG: DUF2164 domain-containing protein [Planctomycetota bacterium]|jgi:uncharacterized protein (DUF2164 family)
MPIEFSDDVRRRLLDALRGFCLDEFGEELGELRLRHVYEFLMGHVAAAAYNQGVADAGAWMHAKLGDLEGDLHEDVPGT